MTDITTYIEGLEEPNKEICLLLKAIIDAELKDSMQKLYHGSPVWFIEDNPILGISIKKGKVSLLFWSGQSFMTTGLKPIGKYKAAEFEFMKLEDINEEQVKGWISESIKVQWNYKDLVKHKGVLEQLK